ncbi:MAG: TIGR02453 family protein, partial [Armatimonadetes bacterium]|nr:TIGR02453 family protein [Armatimonadota bacterium]
MYASPRLKPELLKFLSDLKKNNNRQWFQKNKDRYESDVREPLLKFIEAFEPRLHKISPHFIADARKTGGSLFRIYRDTRFSHDKRPYKTHAGVQFRHERAKDVHAPGFYLHIEPKQVFV